MYARVPHVMAQSVLKVEKLSHIIGTAPILEMARPYGLRPRLWLLYGLSNFQKGNIEQIPFEMVYHFFKLIKIRKCRVTPGC